MAAKKNTDIEEQESVIEANSSPSKKEQSPEDKKYQELAKRCGNQEVVMIHVGLKNDAGAILIPQKTDITGVADMQIFLKNKDAQAEAKRMGWTEYKPKTKLPQIEVAK